MTNKDSGALLWGSLPEIIKSPLRKKQLETIKEYTEKQKVKPLTIIQGQTLADLIKKRDAKPVLPDTCTTELIRVYNQVIYNFNEEVTSKYFEKGKYCEEDGISLLQDTIFHSRKIPIIKNTERFYNEFIEGEPDVILPPVIVDVKNCYDWKTFGDAEMESIYDWQLEGYMELLKCDQAILFYCLVNMPPHMIESECRKHFYASNKYLTFEDPEYLIAKEEIAEKYNFEKFPKWERFKFFSINRNPARIEFLYKRIAECREWLNNYHQSQIEFHNMNKSIMGITPDKEVLPIIEAYK